MGLGQAAREVWSRLGATSFTEVCQYCWPNEKPFEDAWREWVKVSKLPQGSLSSQAIEQLTISELSRHGLPKLENHSRLRAPMAWQDIQSLVEKTLSTIHHQQSPQPMEISAVLTGARCQSCGSQAHQRNDGWYKDETCKTCGKRGHFGKGMSKWKRTDTETREPQVQDMYTRLLSANLDF